MCRVEDTKVEKTGQDRIIRYMKVWQDIMHNFCKSNNLSDIETCVPGQKEDLITLT